MGDMLLRNSYSNNSCRCVIYGSLRSVKNERCVVFDFDKIQAELDALEAGVPKVAQFTDEMDRAIVYAFDQRRNKDAFALWFKKRYGWGCRETINKRYKLLKEKP